MCRNASDRTSFPAWTAQATRGPPPSSIVQGTPAAIYQLWSVRGLSAIRPRWSETSLAAQPFSDPPAMTEGRRDTGGVELIVVPWTQGPLIRIAAPDIDLRRRSGVPIDTSDPDVAALVHAYESFWATAPLDGPSLTLAHTALLETASLLRCGPPAGPAEREYVRRHRQAIVALATADPVAYLVSL